MEKDFFTVYAGQKDGSKKKPHKSTKSFIKSSAKEVKNDEIIQNSSEEEEYDSNEQKNGRRNGKYLFYILMCLMLLLYFIMLSFNVPEEKITFVVFYS